MGHNRSTPDRRLSGANAAGVSRGDAPLLQRMATSFDLNLLLVFDTILTERSVTRAASRLNLSQPAVSGCLARLREVFDDELFVRAQGTMMPTPRALALSIPVRQVVGRIEGIRELGRPFDPATSGQAFTLSCSDYATLVLGPLLQRAIVQEGPATTVSFVDNSGRDLRERLTGGEACFAIDLRHSQGTDLRSAFLLEEELLVIADAGNLLLQEGGVAAGAEIPLDLFCRLPHVTRPSPIREEGMVNRLLAAQGLSRHVRVSMSHYGAMGPVVAGSDLLACLPSVLAADLARQHGLRLHRLPRALGTQPFLVTLFWHRRDDDNEAHRWMRQMIIRCGGVVGARAREILGGMT